MSDFMKSIVAEILERNHPAPAALISVASPVTVAPLVTVTSPVTVPIPAPALASVFAPAPASVSSATATPAAPVASSAPAPGATAASASSAPASASAGPSCSASKQADCPDTCSSPRDCPQPPGGIKRVNYQKQQAGKRLALLGLPGDPGSTESPVSHGSPESLGSHQSHGLPGASPTPIRLPDAAAQLRTSHILQEQPAASTATGRSPAAAVPGDHQSFAERCLSPLLLRTLPTGSVHSSGSGQASIPAGAQHSGKNSAGDIPCRPGGIPGAGATQIKDSAGIPYSRNAASPDTPFPSSGMELLMPGCSL